jgi:hypothetical protein
MSLPFAPISSEPGGDRLKAPMGLNLLQRNYFVLRLGRLQVHAENPGGPGTVKIYVGKADLLP